MIALSAIVVENRQRTDDKSVEVHIEALAREIHETELMHAPILGPGNRLIAGFCRKKAMEKLHAEGKTFKYNGQIVEKGFTPFIQSYSDDATTLFRMELMENLRRKNLSPLDEARHIAALHNMQKQIKGPEWTQGKTLELVNEIRNQPRTSTSTQMDIAESLLISGFADDPEVQAAKTKPEALRIVKKKLEGSLTQGLGDLIKPSTNTNFTLIEADLRLKLGDMPNESFDGIVTDPPYGIEAQDFGDQSTVEGHTYEDTRERALAIATQIFRHGARLVRTGGHLYLFCDIRTFDYLSDIASEAGWKVFATPLIWHKPGLGHAPQPGFFGRRYECILFGRLGDRALASSHSDVFTHPAVKDKRYAAEKPVALLEEMLKLSFLPGDHILDPCCGSGPIFAAGHNAKMKITGMDNNKQAIMLAKELISRLK